MRVTIYFCVFFAQAMDEDLYDEFGTYIGPDIEDESESVSSEEEVWRGREEHVVEPETHMAVETPGECVELRLVF